MTGIQVHDFQMSHHEVGGVVLLDTIETAPGRATAYFKSGTISQSILAARETQIVDSYNVGGGLIAELRYEAAVPRLQLGGQATEILPTKRQLEIFEGLNTVFAIRNGETVEAVLDWLRYFAEYQGLQAALILDRAKPSAAKTFSKNLKTGLGKIGGLEQVVLLSADYPLGQKNLPPESHPINAVDAPGKARMKLPQPSPWSSPLRETQVVELVRRRFLDRARAVAFLDVSDVVTTRCGSRSKGKDIFEMAVNSVNGGVLLVGQNCYPWRVRKGEASRHGDHICVQFDSEKRLRRWCIAPNNIEPNLMWRQTRIAGISAATDEWVHFYRCMGVRHPNSRVSHIVAKSSLIEEPALIELSQSSFDHSPVRMANLAIPNIDLTQNNVTIVTCMKNEGPFILEWLAYHRAIGVKNVLVYTNDCDDGTETLLKTLQSKGYVHHRENPFESMGQKPQHAALGAAKDEKVVKEADWLISMDVDEFINVKIGDGTLNALFMSLGSANMISFTWRLFGNSDIHEFSDKPVLTQFTRCAREITRKPHQAWGFKTLFRNVGLFRKLGVHRPKGLNSQLWHQIKWVNGSGVFLPKEMFRNAWRSTTKTVGYDLVQLNHYAVRSAESFLVKRDRGRVNHVDRDQGLAYWFRMNNNAVEDTSIQRMIPAMEAERERLLADPDIAESHSFSVDRHRAKIKALRKDNNYKRFYKSLTSSKFEKLSRMHEHFGANVFLLGPEALPNWIADREHPSDFFYTIDKRELPK